MTVRDEPLRRAGGIIAGTFATRLLSLLLTALLYVVAARTLGTRNFGAAAELIGAVSVGTVIADAGTSNHVLRDLAEGLGYGSAGAAFRWRLLTAMSLGAAATAVAGIMAIQHRGLITIISPLAVTLWGYGAQLRVPRDGDPRRPWSCDRRSGHWSRRSALRSGRLAGTHGDGTSRVVCHVHRTHCGFARGLHPRR